MTSVPHLLSAREAADILNVTPETISAYAKRGILRGARNGRAWLVYADSVAEFKARRDAPKKKPRIDPGPTKVCKRCHTERPTSEYGRDKRYLDNLQPWCKACYAEYHNQPKQKEQRHNQYKKRYADPVYRAKHRTKSNAYTRQRWNADSEYRQRKNLSKKIINHRRRMQKRRGDLTIAQWQAICVRYGPDCLCCGEKRPLTLDHIRPLSRGGEHTAENVQPLCGPCNNHKKTRTIDYRPDRGAWLYEQTTLALDY